VAKELQKHKHQRRFVEHEEPESVDLPYRNRFDAGRVLADALGQYGGRADVLVLALPRGGVPVASIVAQELGASLDLLLVRKLGVPGWKELAMGAIATGGVRVLNPDVVDEIGIAAESIDKVAHAEQQELHRRERVYRGERPLPTLKDQCVILIDDGLATGATMRAAIQAVRQQQPARLVVAVPVAPAHTIAMLKMEVDEVVCPAMLERFFSIGQWYEDFSQITDDEVRTLLERAWKQQAGNTEADTGE
jgi:putative phosphoribosyl transferase